MTVACVGDVLARCVCQRAGRKQLRMRIMTNNVLATEYIRNYQYSTELYQDLALSLESLASRVRKISAHKSAPSTPYGTLVFHLVFYSLISLLL